MVEMLQDNRNASVDLNQMEHQAQEAIKADTAVTASKFGGPASANAGSASPAAAQTDSAVMGEMALHAGAALLGPVAVMATAAASIGWQAYQSSRPGSKKEKSSFPGVSTPAAATTQKTITPGLVTRGGKRGVVNSRFQAGPGLTARQAGGALAASFFMTRQSMFSLNNNQTTKGLKAEVAKQGHTSMSMSKKPMPTAQHLLNLGAIRKDKAQGPKVIANAKIQSHDVYTAAAKGNEVVLDKLVDYAAEAKALPPQAPAAPKSTS